jgi:oleandomycin transport system ATP-binding protein
VAGHDVVEEGTQVRAAIGAALQEAALDPFLTGREHVRLQASLHGIRGAERKRRMDALLERVGLTYAADRKVGTYSGGMKRRLDLALALVHRPSILFLDEPTTGLDPRSRLGMWQIVRELVADGVTVLLTTQYLDEADELADDIAVVDHGRVIATGTPAQLKARTGAQPLVVRPADAADLPIVTSIVRDLTGEAPVVDGTTVTAAVTDAALLPAVVRRLDDADVLVAELALRDASLDEVFLSLTGHRAEETTDTADLERTSA